MLRAVLLKIQVFQNVLCHPASNSQCFKGS